jgi:hypothetical protein
LFGQFSPKEAGAHNPQTAAQAAIVSSMSQFQDEVAAALDEHWRDVATLSPIPHESGARARERVASSLESAKRRGLAIALHLQNALPSQGAPQWDAAFARWNDECQRSAEVSVRELVLFPGSSRD